MNIENLHKFIYGKSSKTYRYRTGDSTYKKLDPSFGKIIEAIRQIILKTDKEIGEHIKWNNPSFYYTGEMKAF